MIRYLVNMCVFFFHLFVELANYIDLEIYMLDLGI